MLSKRYRWAAVGAGTSVLVAVIILLYSFPLFADASTGENSECQEYIEVIVRRGDTLWGIAREYNHNNLDLRVLVFQIKKASGLKTSLLTPGQKLHIPR